MADPISEIVEGKLKRKAVRSHTIIYDSPSETLEPVYFWVLDMMNNFFKGKVEKVIDNFTSSPGSGHFAEIGQRKSIMQKNVSETMGTVNTVIKSIINLIYDLKEFEIRLEHYKLANSKNKEEAEAGLLALKQIWMDNVDIKRGQGSINGLTSGNLNFITLRDAFMSANSLKDVDKIDLNDRVKRILKPRLAEFLEWKVKSELEIRQRFNIEKNYLKSQANMLQLYSRWVKPYLKAAAELEMKDDSKSPELITAFNTIIFELLIMGKIELEVKEAIDTRKVPKGIKPKRKYYSVVTVNFHFRGIPQKVGQHYVFGGRATVNFKAYALNEQEIDFFNHELKKSEMNDMFRLIEGTTTESLDEMKKDIDHFINEKSEAQKEKEKPVDTNPFTALFGLFGKSEEKSKKEEKKPEEKIELDDIKKDSFAERLIRKLAEDNASETCYTIFDVYKKAHGMASHDSPFE